jgi:hypothetical protein
MNVRSLAKGLAYRGEVSGKRQTYYVFEGDKSFAVFSFSRTKPNSGNFNIVRPDAIEYVRARFAGSRGVTARDVVAKGRGSRRVRNPLTALNVLYVLAALGDVTIDTRRAGPKLYFNFKSRRA